MTHLEKYLAEVEERLRKAESDPSLISRIPMWITAGDGRQWMYEVRTDIPRLLEIIRVQSEALKFYANQEVKKSFDGIPMTDVDVMYTGVGRACIAIDKCEEIAKGE